jgi:hypothetical protein
LLSVVYSLGAVTVGSHGWIATTEWNQGPGVWTTNNTLVAPGQRAQGITRLAEVTLGGPGPGSQTVSAALALNGDTLWYNINRRDWSSVSEPGYAFVDVVGFPQTTLNRQCAVLSVRSLLTSHTGFVATLGANNSLALEGYNNNVIANTLLLVV